MTESNSQPEEPKAQSRFSQEQYDFLRSCSEKDEEGIKEWNEWRSEKQNRHKDIHLEGAPLGGRYLKNIDLGLKGVEYNGEWSGKKGTSEVFLREANLRWANLQGAKLMGTHLEGAKMGFAHLEDADVSDAHLESTQCARAVVDYTTSLWECKVDRKTDFLGVNLEAAKIDPGTKQLLEYNIRRKNWEEWYKEHRILRWPVWWFWLLSDYGLRTSWIIAWFFGLAFAFALLYWLLPNTVMVKETGGDIRGLWHALYFSVVTMTTLDFGDIAANPDSWLGQTLLMIQVILGYVLLGALVTRFAVLFTAGGPAGEFADRKTMESL